MTEADTLNPFEDGTVYERPPVPVAVKDRPPTPTRYAIERFGLADAWEARFWVNQHFDEAARKYSHLKLDGAVYPHKIARGPRKGTPNFKRPEPGTETTVTIAYVDFDIWLDRWERATGFCSACSGTGFALAGWSHDKGNRYRSCKRCSQTGRRAP